MFRRQIQSLKKKCHYMLRFQFTRLIADAKLEVISMTKTNRILIF